MSCDWPILTEHSHPSPHCSDCSSWSCPQLLLPALARPTPSAPLHSDCRCVVPFHWAISPLLSCPAQPKHKSRGYAGSFKVALYTPPRLRSANLTAGAVLTDSHTEPGCSQSHLATAKVRMYSLLSSVCHHIIAPAMHGAQKGHSRRLQWRHVPGFQLLFGSVFNVTAAGSHSGWGLFSAKRGFTGVCCCCVDLAFFLAKLGEAGAGKQSHMIARPWS